MHRRVALFFSCLSLVACSDPAAVVNTTIITNAVIHDGSGNEPFHGAVRIGGDRIIAVGDIEKAENQLAKADDDAAKKSGNEIAEGNKELKKSIDSYADGHNERGASHYDKAMTSYDSALDLMG